MHINIKEILNQKAKSIYWLSEETNISYRNLHNLVKNKTSSIRFDILEKICIALDCTPNDILKIEKQE